MDLMSWLAFAASSTLLLAAPGPMVALTVTRVSARGFASAAPLAAGAAAGDAAALVLSLAGLGALLEASGNAFAALKLAGAGYLLWLAGNALREPVAEAAPRLRAATSFRDAFLLTALHPGGFIFFLAYFPLFVNPEDPVVTQFVLLGTTFVVLSAATVFVWAGAGAAGTALLQSAPAQRRLNQLSGGLMGLLGCVAAVEAGIKWLSSREFS